MATFELRAGDAAVIEVQLTRKDGTLQPLVGTETGSFIFSSWSGDDLLTVALAMSDAPTSKVKATLSGAQTLAQHGRVLRLRIPVVGLETFPTAPDDLIVVFY